MAHHAVAALVPALGTVAVACGAGPAPTVGIGEHMKARRVIITLEVDTDARLTDIKRVFTNARPFNGPWTVQQVQVNVIRKK